MRKKNIVFNRGERRNPFSDRRFGGLGGAFFVGVFLFFLGDFLSWFLGFFGCFFFGFFAFLGLFSVGFCSFGRWFCFGAFFVCILLIFSGLLVGFSAGFCLLARLAVFLFRRWRCIFFAPFLSRFAGLCF